MLDPNIVYRDRNKQTDDNIVDVRFINLMTLNCVDCNVNVPLDLRDINTLDLSKVRCGTCKKHDVIT